MKVTKTKRGYHIEFEMSGDNVFVGSNSVILRAGGTPEAEHAVELGLALKLAGEAAQQLKAGATQTVLDMWLRDINVEDKAL